MKTKKTEWFQAKVIPGNNIGDNIGFPTINLDNPAVLKEQQEGVYLVKVKIRNSFYNGLLFFGPRLVLNEKENILEIYIIGFSENIYGEKVSFRIIKYLRAAKFFPNLESLRKQLEIDYKIVQKILSSSKK